MYLRQARLETGLSLRELERKTGVSDSEIYKIETGDQECRLSSFIKVCAALGVPGGLVLDQVVSSSMAYFFPLVANDPDFASFAASRWTLNNFARHAVIDQIACLCSVAAHLLRCSDATRKAQSLRYPGPDTEKAFVAFGQLVDATSEGLERLSILAALERTPITELHRHNLICTPLLQDVVKKAKRARAQPSLVPGIIRGEGVPIWWPLPAPQTPFAKGAQRSRSKKH
jgi:transcriptional regulator with XRE-family HTH domain